MGLEQSHDEVSHSGESFDYRAWILGGLLVAGVVIVSYGVWIAVRPDEPIVEITKNQDGISAATAQTKIYVDVGGAVEKPGVYALASQSRIGDALVAAGGLSALADREYVGKTLNLAEVVKDGAKIYIPKQSDTSEDLANLNNGKSVHSESRGSLININTASQSELESLWGIGTARAQAIITARPYTTLDELVSKAKIPQSVYDKIKDQISLY